MIISFAALAYFSQRLGAAAVGSYFLYQALVQMFAFASDLGFNDAVVKRISERENPGAILSTALIVKILLIVPFIVGVFVFDEAIYGYVGLNVALLVNIGALLSVFSTMYLMVLQAEMKMQAFALLQLSNKVVFVISGVILLSADFEVLSLIYGMILGNGFTLVVALLHSDTTPGVPSMDRFHSLWEFSKYNVATKLGGRAVSWVDVLVIGALLGQAPAGAYEVAWRVSKFSIIIASSVGNVIFPKVSKLDSENTTRGIRSAIKDGFALGLLVPIPALFGILIFSQDILSLLFGSEFTMAWQALIVLAVGRVSMSVNIVFQKTLQGINRVKQVGMVKLATAVLNLITNVALVWLFGIVGAAVATTVSITFGGVLMYYWLSQSLEVVVELWLVAWYVVASLVMTAVLLGVMSFVEIASVFHLLGLVALGAGIYTLVVWSSSTVRDRVWARLR